MKRRPLINGTSYQAFGMKRTGTFKSKTCGEMTEEERKRMVDAMVDTHFLRCFTHILGSLKVVRHE